MKKLLLVLLVSTPALAQEVEVEPEPSTQKVKFKERTEIDFTGVEVNATVDGPSLASVTVTSPADDFNPLIHIRKDFSPEMQQSVDHIK